MASTRSDRGRHGDRTASRTLHPIGPGALLLGALLLYAPASALAQADPAGLERVLARTIDVRPLPDYDLIIEPKPLRRLLDYLERIRAQPALSPFDQLWVDASFQHRGERYPVKLRIRGDLPAHWRGDRQSLRVKFRKRLFEGRKEINLILPFDKHLGVEILQTQIAAELGLPNFPARFVHLRINGADAGFYLESEHPTRQYLERTGRPPSSIFTFSAYWNQYFSKPYHAAFVFPGSEQLQPLDGPGQIRQRGTFDPDRPELARRQLDYVLAFHRLMSAGSPAQIAARGPQYLDLDNFAAYVALQNFFGTQHALQLNDNIRLYLDPTSGHFQFMPWDTALRPLRPAPGAVVSADPLVPDDPAFAALLGGVPGLERRRDRVLVRLVHDGDRYRARLNELHARLIRLYPDDEKLREAADGFDRNFADNLVVLRRLLSARGGSG